MNTPMLDRIKAINERGKKAFEKRKCLIVTDKNEIDLVLDKMDRERLSKQEFNERFISKKMDSESDNDSVLS